MKEPLGERKVLNAGLVALMSLNGSDLTPVEAARTSYRDFADEHTQEENENLIDYLIRHYHSTPLEFPDATFYITMPIFVARQFVRHRLLSINETSLRYVEPTEDFYIPSREECKGKPKNNKQGTSEELLNNMEITSVIGTIAGNGLHSKKDYDWLQKHGLANELCRTVLPLGQYTTWYVKCNLRGWFHFLNLRLDSHAQYQIRVYATAILELLEEHFPIICKAYRNHVLEAKTFSLDEWNLIEELIYSDNQGLEHYEVENKLEGWAKQSGMRPSRIKELLAKLK